MQQFNLRTATGAKFSRPETLSPLLYELLRTRGISSAEEAHAFLHPSVDQLRDPFLLSDMKPAVERIQLAIMRGERICVYGDYDVDGVCASAILADYFAQEDVDCSVYLPSRHKEGYGLNEAALRAIAREHSLLITVDCGINAVSLVEEAKSLGLDCVITDHHRPGETLPDCPTVNPLLADYPFGRLCGAGVAMKLVGALGGEEEALERIDLAAIATVADVVPLLDENRAIVSLGLKKLRKIPRLGLQTLAARAKLELKTVTAMEIAFRIAPRLNAAGRLGDARRAFDLLTAREEFLAEMLADELEQENTRRQSLEREIRAEAEQQLEEVDFSAHRILMPHGKGWNSGVIGLVASHLREKYAYPVIVFAENEEGNMVGSCRSIEGVDIFQTLSSASSMMIKFGGHAQAAGLTIRADMLEPLQAALDKYLSKNASPELYIPSESYDKEATLTDFDERNVAELALLEPFGCANPEPVFRTKAELVELRAVGAEGAHLRIVAQQNDTRRSGIWFGMGELAQTLSPAADLLFTPQLNSWQGRVEVQLMVRAIRGGDIAQRLERLQEQEGSARRAFMTELLYNRKARWEKDIRQIEPAELDGLLGDTIHGSYILCSSLKSAERIFAAIQSAQQPDLYFGQLPTDERVFNSVVICPNNMKQWPRALRRVVLADLPLPEGLPQNIELVRLNMGENFAACPDLEQLRIVYRALKWIAVREQPFGSIEALDEQLSHLSGMKPDCCHIAFLIFYELKLFKLEGRVLMKLRMMPCEKPVFEQSRIFRTLSEQ